MELPDDDRRLGFSPALAAGNAVVLKPAELTPLTAMRLGELALEAGLPEGLFEVVTGSGSVVGQRFVSHHDVRKVVFTGSTEVGTDVAAGVRVHSSRSPSSSAERARTSSSRMPTSTRGGIGAGAVFDNAGQDCCAPQPHLVQRSVFDRFLELSNCRGGLACRRPALGGDSDGPAHLGPRTATP